MHPYFLHQRAEAHWQTLHRMSVAARPRPVPVRARVGEALVLLGQRIAASRPAAAAPASPCG